MTAISGIVQTTTWDPEAGVARTRGLFYTIYFDENGKMTLVEAGVGRNFVEAMSGPVEIRNPGGRGSGK